jgi:hypothetical protein
MYRWQPRWIAWTGCGPETQCLRHARRGASAINGMHNSGFVRRGTSRAPVRNLVLVVVVIVFRGAGLQDCGSAAPFTCYACASNGLTPRDAVCADVLIVLIEAPNRASRHALLLLIYGEDDVWSE